MATEENTLITLRYLYLKMQVLHLTGDQMTKDQIMEEIHNLCECNRGKTLGPLWDPVQKLNGHITQQKYHCMTKNLQYPTGKTRKIVDAEFRKLQNIIAKNR